MVPPVALATVEDHLTVVQPRLNRGDEDQTLGDVSNRPRAVGDLRYATRVVPSGSDRDFDGDGTDATGLDERSSTDTRSGAADPFLETREATFFGRSKLATNCQRTDHETESR